jgi:heme exporter protein B
MTESTFGIYRSIIQKDIKLAWSQGGTGPLAVGFFIIAASMFPLGLGPEPTILARIAPSILWVMALLACLLSLDRMYQADYEDGSLDQLAFSPIGLFGISVAKILSHWITALLPLVIATPLLGLMLNLPASGFFYLILTFIIGTPALSAIGSVGASLTVAIRRGGVLIALLTLPLYVPVLIFAVGAIEASITAVDPSANLALLGAVTLVSLLIGPLASSAALRLALE